MKNILPGGPGRPGKPGWPGGPEMPVPIQLKQVSPLSPDEKQILLKGLIKPSLDKF